MSVGVHRRWVITKSHMVTWWWDRRELGCGWTSSSWSLMVSSQTQHSFIDWLQFVPKLLHKVLISWRVWHWPLTSDEKCAEWRVINSCSCRSRSQRLRSMSHDRIPARKEEKHLVRTIGRKCDEAETQINSSHLCYRRCCSGVISHWSHTKSRYITLISN